MPKISRQCPIALRSKQDSARRLTFAITTLTVDRDGEVVDPRGGRFESYLANPVVLFAHNTMDLPVARTLGLEKTDREILAEAEFAGLEQLHPFAETVFRLYRDGFLRAVSVGFLPIKTSRDRMLPGQTGVTHLEWELLEFSAVPIPGNPDALIRRRLARAFGLPSGASEADLLGAIRRDRKVWFDVAQAVLIGQKQLPSSAICAAVQEGVRNALDPAGSRLRRAVEAGLARALATERRRG